MRGRSRSLPPLPTPVCDSVQAPAGERLVLRAHAVGVQVYRWNGTQWVFVAPEATLFADSCYRGQIGTHFAGPTWEMNDGSQVVGARLAGCTPFPGAIPWLLLRVVSGSEQGRLAEVTHIQRVGTVGGTAPVEPGSAIGEEARVPYTAEYYFFAPTHRQ